MNIAVKQTEERIKVKRYEIPYPVSVYTFPREASIHHVRFDDVHIHIELTDGRILSVPLQWIPTLYHASPDEREKYEIDPSRMTLFWDADKCNINDELHIADYLGSGRA